jgi:DNA polymerase-3 subunit delta'
MRSIVLTAGRLPSLGRWQIVLVEDADRLTEAASNALLKAVEEPPERTVFLLCAPSTHPDDVAITIRSRCRVVPLGTPSPEPSPTCWYGGTASIRPRRTGRPRRRRAMSAGPGGWPATRGARPPEGRAVRADVADQPRGLLRCRRPAGHRGRAGGGGAVGRARRPETEALKQAFGAGGTGKGAAAATRGTAGALKELERRQRSRATRAQRDALDRALVDLPRSTGTCC